MIFRVSAVAFAALAALTTYAVLTSGDVVESRRGAGPVASIVSAPQLGVNWRH